MYVFIMPFINRSTAQLNTSVSDSQHHCSPHPQQVSAHSCHQEVSCFQLEVHHGNLDEFIHVLVKHQSLPTKATNVQSMLSLDPLFA